MKVAKIGELVGVVTTWNPSRRPDAEFKYIDLSAVDNGSKAILSSTTMTGAEAPSRARQLVSAGDVLVSTVRPNLNAVAVVPTQLDGATASTGFTVLRPSEELDGHFLFHWVQSHSFIADMVRKATGASYPAVSDRIVKDSTIPALPLPEQRRIASILDHADALRAKRRQALAHLSALTPSIFHRMFHHTTAVVSFGAVIAEGPTNGLYRPSSDYGSGTPILRIDSFDAGAVKDASWKRVRISDSELSRYSLAVGDVVINRVNALSHLGKSALIERLQEPSVFESNMMRIRVDEDRVSPRFVIAWLQSFSARQQLLSKAKKSINQASINQGDVRSLVMPLPSRGLQASFVSHARAIEAHRVVTRSALTAHDELFASLQLRAFRGELC